MKILFLIFFLVIITGNNNYLFSQTGETYVINRYESIYIPLGKISFADSIVNFNLGNPAPYKKYQDSSQALNEPNYRSYDKPDYVSIGCKGTLTVAFTDNGFMNLKGNDLYIFEVGPSKEAARIEISENGEDWIFAGNISGGKSIIDLEDQNISTKNVFYFVRIIDQKAVCRSKTAGADIDAIGAINCVIRLTLNTKLLFKFDEYNIQKSADSLLLNLTNTIQKFDKATILIDGHTDSDGNESYNLDLSSKRCHSVTNRLKTLLQNNSNYDYLINSYGESKPRVTNSSDHNKQLNRRVEITILPPLSYYESLNEN
jgi:outer membrane protein OmpA-like peptidoglycan-associated protein